MNRFILVYQQYFGRGNGIRVVELGADVTSSKQAMEQLYIAKGHLSYDGYEVEGTVLEIGAKETTHFAPRKLTWKERFTGRIDPSITESIPAERTEAKVVKEPLTT